MYLFESKFSSKVMSAMAWVTAVLQIQSLAEEFLHTPGTPKRKKKKKAGLVIFFVKYHIVNM